MLVLLVPIALQFSVGCAYYNYFYNARKHYREAENQQREAGSRQPARRVSGSSNYDKAIESAGKMLAYYPGSKWEDDALLLIAKAYYRTSKYRSAAGKIDELEAKYPLSELIPEGRLWKGMSLFKLAQPDSARQLLSELTASESSDLIAAQAHLAVGDYYYDDKRWDQALEEYELAAERAGDDEWLRGQAWVRSGECLGLARRHEDAVRFYDRVLARKIPRRLRFEASLQRGVALREAGQIDEAMQVFDDLLDDGAYFEDFPRIELEMARAEAITGRQDDAIARLARSVEGDKRGEVAADAQYELGRLLWQVRRDYGGAVAAFKAVKQAERTARSGPLADSLLAEVEALSKYWYHLRFIERQMTLIDSVQRGLRAMTSADTAFVDSLAPFKDKTPDRTSRASRSRTRDPLARMVEEAKARGDTLGGDTTVSKITAEFDSTAVARIDSLRRASRLKTWLQLAEFHLFERNAADSAGYYLRLTLDQPLDTTMRARALATLAFVARSSGDTTAHDSLYSLILAEPPDPGWEARARKALGRAVEPVVSDMERIMVEAESLWTAGDPTAARHLYLLASASADSGDSRGARALLGAAYITKRVLGEDTLAAQLYGEVVTRFPGSAEARIAQRKYPGQRPTAAPRTPAPKQEMPASPAPEDEFYDRFEMSMPDPSIEEERIYDAAMVDEPPVLTTLPEILRSHLSNYYPMEALAENVRGRVEVELVVSRTGDPRDVVVLMAEPEGRGFDRVAPEVMSLLQYRPGRHQGRPVAVRMKQVLEFPPLGEN